MLTWILVASLSAVAFLQAQETTVPITPSRYAKICTSFTK